MECDVNVIFSNFTREARCIHLNKVNFIRDLYQVFEQVRIPAVKYLDEEEENF
jgi:hypothetical protein